MDTELATIAQDVLNIKTLETRNSDELDFHDCAVWKIKEALEKAYQAGRDSKHDCLLYVNPKRDCQALKMHEERRKRTS